jgi:TPR repeat protein
VGVPVRDRLGSAACHADGLSWSLWGAVGGNVSAMFTAACCYRDGVGARRDRVQAVRWYLAMLACGDGDGVHEAIELVKRGMTDAQIVEAGRLAGQEGDAWSLIKVVPARQRWRRWWHP